MVVVVNNNIGTRSCPVKRALRSSNPRDKCWILFVVAGWLAIAVVYQVLSFKTGLILTFHVITVV